MLDEFSLEPNNLLAGANVPPMIYSEALKEKADYRVLSQKINIFPEGIAVTLSQGTINTPQEVHAHSNYTGILDEIIADADLVYGACSNFWLDSEGLGKGFTPAWIIEFGEYVHTTHTWVKNGTTDGHTNFICNTTDCGLKVVWSPAAGHYVYEIPE